MDATFLLTAGLFGAASAVGGGLLASGCLGRRRCEEARRVRDLETEHRAALAASEAKTDFLAHMSHEIRNPLNALLGMAELLEETPLQPRQREYLELLRGSGEVLLRIVNDALDLSRIEAGGIELVEEAFDLGECVVEAVRSLRAQAQAKGIALECGPSVVSAGWRRGDAVRLRQVVVNLVSNALKFTDEGGVTVDLDGGPAQEVHLRVRDTGCGIDEATLARLFRPYQQAEATTHRQHGGTGLGLVISRRLCELMGGRVWAESRVGEGSTFHALVHLPVADPPRARASAEPAEGLSVLVAEDNPVNQKVVAAFLESLGCTEVVLVGDGRAAVEAAGRRHFHLVLLDTHLPGMDGLTAARYLRRQHAGPGRPLLVALTGKNTEDHRQRCLNAGMDEFLAKPVRKDELARVLALASLPEPVL